MKRIEVLISGFGGQGVVRLGQIFSTAAVHAGWFTTMLVSHGTETRGGYVRAQVVLADEPIDSPVVERPDFLCALSRAAYARFAPGVRGGPDGGLVLFDPAYVEPDAALSATRHLALPAKELALRELGAEIFANIVFLGALARLLQPDAAIANEHFLRALAERVPKFPEKNRAAFELGGRCRSVPTPSHAQTPPEHPFGHSPGLHTSSPIF